MTHRVMMRFMPDVGMEKLGPVKTGDLGPRRSRATAARRSCTDRADSIDVQYSSLTFAPCQPTAVLGFSAWSVIRLGAPWSHFNDAPRHTMSPTGSDEYYGWPSALPSRIFRSSSVVRRLLDPESFSSRRWITLGSR